MRKEWIDTDYYAILGVSKDASQQEIKKAFRKLARDSHPDANNANSDTQFKQINKAYEVLSDAQKRARYDRFGHSDFAQAGGGRQFTDVNDIFEAFGDIFGGGIFGDMFGRGRRRQGPRRGRDVKCQVTLTLEEAALGTEKTVEFHRSKSCTTCEGAGSKPGSKPQPCVRCAGSGQIVQQAGILHVQTTCPSCSGHGARITDPCHECRGSGQVQDVVSLDVSIPAGVEDGMRVRLPGEGESGPDGGAAGDCYCFISITEHEIFHRDGRHLILKMPITYTQATLGAKIEVPTIGGRVHELTIPAGTQLGEVFQLTGRGMPDPRGAGAGDLLIQVYIDIPKSVNGRHEDLLRELAEVEHANVSPHRKTFLEKLKDYFVAADDAVSNAKE